jgi:hypothetical protein
MRKFVCAAVVTAVAFSVATAETYFGRITKLTDKEVTFNPFKKGEKEPGEAKTLPVTDDTTYLKGGGFKKKKDAGEVSLQGGKGKGKAVKLTAKEAQDYVKDGGEKGRFGIITTKGEGKDEKVTEIRFFGGKKGGKKKPKDDTN